MGILMSAPQFHSHFILQKPHHITKNKTQYPTRHYLLAGLITFSFIFLFTVQGIALASLYPNAILLAENNAITPTISQLQKNAEQGDIKAQTKLGILFFTRHDGKESDTKAKDFFEQAAAQGDAEAEYFLGIIYIRGRGVEKDADKALSWFKKAANQGYVGGQYALGILYGDGKYVKQDLEKAHDWFEKAATQGNSESQLYLGQMFLHGSGTDKDSTKAMYWYEKATRQGCMLALSDMIDALAKDINLLENPAHAYGYILVLKTLEPDNKELKKKQENWRKQLSRAQIKEGIAFAKQLWKDIGASDKH